MLNLKFQLSTLQRPKGKVKLVETAVVFSRDIEFSEGIRKEYSKSFEDFMFTMYVDSVHSENKGVALAFSKDQREVDRLGQLVNASLNNVIIEDFKGHTMKLWVKEVITPNSVTGKEAIVAINIRVIHWSPLKIKEAS